MVCEQDHKRISLGEGDDDEGSFDAFIPPHPRQPHGQDSVSCHPGKGHLQMWLEIGCGY